MELLDKEELGIGCKIGPPRLDPANDLIHVGGTRCVRWEFPVRHPLVRHPEKLCVVWRWHVPLAAFCAKPQQVVCYSPLREEMIVAARLGSVIDVLQPNAMGATRIVIQEGRRDVPIPGE